METIGQDHTVLLAACGSLGFLFLAGIVWLYKRRRKFIVSSFDDLEGHEFEFYCADLLRQNGFVEVEVTKGSGDYGADILAEKDGVTYAIQCKRYQDSVGVKAVQEAHSGRDFYDRMVGAVLTNQYFTASAVEAAKKLKILLWDRTYLEELEEG